MGGSLSPRSDNPEFLGSGSLEGGVTDCLELVTALGMHQLIRKELFHEPGGEVLRCAQRAVRRFPAGSHGMAPSQERAASLQVLFGFRLVGAAACPWKERELK